jgi:prepilin-type processing-associated H-X9-DG protein
MDIDSRQGCRRAFTRTDLVVVVMVVVVIIIGALFVSAYTGARRYVQGINCVNNLKQAGLDFRLWSGDSKDRFQMGYSTNVGGTLEYVPGGNAFRHFQCMSNEIKEVKFLVCPADDRLPARSFKELSNANVSYFVGVDADEAEPSLWLAGDRNLTTNGIPVGAGLVELKATNAIGWSKKMHKFVGNIVFADGSVQQLSQAGVNNAFGSTGTNVNRLAVP